MAEQRPIVVIGVMNYEVTEYFCTNCLQMRLSLNDDKSHCFHCGSKHIITGKPETLDKQALLKQYASKKD